jgi:tagatose-1,6-bisphosphate aldolase non-catalytic subunit AgaZ/GatZ
MRKVTRADVLDYKTYNDRREAFRARILEEKAKRRIHLGEHLTFLFESTDTMLYQVQEMMRLEQTVRESEIMHEVDTYNQLLGGDGELGCTLLIEIDNAADRAKKLAAWLGLPGHLYIKLDDGALARAVWDPMQVGDGRLSSVQYLKFPVGTRVPVAIGSDHPDLRVEAALSDAQRETLRLDARSA